MIDRFSIIWGLMIGMFSAEFFGLTMNHIFWLTMALTLFHGVATAMDNWAEASG